MKGRGVLIFRVTVLRNATPEGARKRQARRILRNREYFPPFGAKLTPWELPSNTAPDVKRADLTYRYYFIYIYTYTYTAENFILFAMLQVTCR